MFVHVYIVTLRLFTTQVDIKHKMKYRQTDRQSSANCKANRSITFPGSVSDCESGWCAPEYVQNINVIYGYQTVIWHVIIGYCCTMLLKISTMLHS